MPNEQRYSLAKFVLFSHLDHKNKNYMDTDCIIARSLGLVNKPFKEIVMRRQTFCQIAEIGAVILSILSIVIKKISRFSRENGRGLNNLSQN